MRGTCSAGLCMMVLASSAPAAAEEAITEETLQEILEAPSFRGLLGDCFTSPDRPVEITLIITIDGTGSATLSGVEPLLLKETTSCIARAVTGLDFPLTGDRYEISTSMAVPEYEAAPEPPPVVAPPLPAPPQPVVPPPPATESEVRSLKKKGYALLIPGATLLAGGIVMFVVGGAIAGLASLGDECNRVCVTALAVFGAGNALIVVGAVMTAMGKRRLRQANLLLRGAGSLVPSVSFHPVPGGVGSSLTWRF